MHNGYFMKYILSNWKYESSDTESESHKDDDYYSDKMEQSNKDPVPVDIYS